MVGYHILYIYVPVSHRSPLQPKLHAHRPGAIQLPWIQSPSHSNVKLLFTLFTMSSYTSAVMREREEGREREGEVETEHAVSMSHTCVCLQDTLIL